MDLKNGTQKRAEKSTTNRPQIHRTLIGRKAGHKTGQKSTDDRPKIDKKVDLCTF
jgi:hypothetical protein